MLTTFFPRTTYKNKTIVDLTKSVRVAKAIENVSANFIGFSIPEGDRPEVVAYDYYDDASLAWLVLLPNKVLDPYYEWPLPQRTFERWMIEKYTSLELSQSTILFYEHKTKNITISKDTYDHSGSLTYVSAADYNPVYAYDYYDRINNNNRHIKLISNDALPVVFEDLERVFGDGE